MASVKFAVIDVNDFLSKKQASEPDLAADWAKLEELYNKKLWHQLTLKVQELVQHPSLKRDDHLIQLYHNFITTFENKINPLSLVDIIAHVIEQFPDKREAIEFLQKIETKVKVNDEAVAFCKVLQGQLYLSELRDLPATEVIIDQLDHSLGDADGVTPLHGQFYKLASDYYKVRGPMSSYYRSLLRWAGCVGGGSELPPEERARCALELTRAALLAPTVYDLSALLTHPLLTELATTPHRWAYNLLEAAARGDAAAYDVALQNAPIPDFKENDHIIRRKLALLCLCQMAFERSSSQRRLSFEEISRAARVPLDEVELLLMKALAEKLIRGHIDQVGECGVITWVRPRALGREGAALLARRLHAWSTAAAAAESLLANAAPDLLTV